MEFSFPPAPPARTLRIVLVRSRNSLNIGAAARAMANFGLDDLVLVEPYDEAWRVARSARAGASVLEQARVVERLADALDGCAYVIGTTAGTARTPELPLEEWGTVAAALPPTGAALLFGSEKTGLGVDEISYCNRLARIPTRPHAPSMNLGQAVAICAYEWSRGAAAPAGEPARAAVTVAERERILAAWYPLLERIGVVRAGHRESQTRALREMLVRWRLGPEDGRRLLGTARQLRHTLARAAAGKAEEKVEPPA